LNNIQSFNVYLTEMITVEIKNIDQLIANMNRLDVRWTINTSLRKSLLALEREVKIVTPVDTWLLRNSYEMSFWDLTATLSNFREYGIYVDAKQNFLQKGIDSSEDIINNIFNNDINNLLQTL